MAQPKTAIADALKSQEPETDGRRARSKASRSKIIRAMMDLIVEGITNPSTADVAARAGVGLRSVFRHFDDKDAIFREIDAILVKANQPILDAPYQSNDWQGQLFEMIERRCEISEAIAPFRIATTSSGRRSKFLRENYRRLHEAEKARLDQVLPAKFRTTTDPGRAILVATSFDTWRFLRQDEDLSASETVAAVKRLVQDVIKRG